MKKNIVIMMLVSFSFSFSMAVYDAANHRTNMLVQIEAAKQTIEQVQHTKNQIDQLHNQFKQLENDAKNLKQIGKELTSGNLDHIKNGLNRILDFDNQTKSSFFKTQNFIKDFDELYKTNIQLSDSYKLGLDKGIKENKKSLDNVRNETRKVVSDAMREGSFNPTLNDKRNIEMLVQKASTTEGALESIQVANNILGQMATNLVEIRNLLGKSVVVAGAVNEESRQSTVTEEQKIQKTIDDEQKKILESQNEAEKFKNKVESQKINVNWKGV